jgi:hypothetical protein
MALRMYVQSVVENKIRDTVESYSISIFIAEESAPTKILAKKAVEINANQTGPEIQTELKSKLTAFWLGFKSKEARRQQMVSKAQAVLDDMLTMTTTTSTTTTTTT